MYTTANVELTEVQKNILAHAIKLLKPFDKEDCSFSLHYFKKNNCDGEEIGEQVCDKDLCVKNHLKDLRQRIGKGKHIYTEYDNYNNGDHDCIERCANCGRPLNEQLTWIRSEFDHHQKYTITKKDFTDSSIAFEVRCMLEAMPSADYRISSYAVHEAKCGNLKPYITERKIEKKFVESVINYAKLAIKELNKK